MSRYFFDVLDEENFLDREGVEFQDLETMLLEAMRAAGAMIGERLKLSHDRPWTMVIRDEQRKIIRTFVFDTI